jgi:hypothetical protein
MNDAKYIGLDGLHAGLTSTERRGKNKTQRRALAVPI